MSKFTKTGLCILLVIILTSTIYGKKKNDNELLKVFVSKENLDTFNFFLSTEYKWEDQLVYSQLKKLKEPFLVVKKNKEFGIKIAPKISDVLINKVNTDLYKEGDWWKANTEYEISLSVELIISDFKGRRLDTISKKFKQKGIKKGTSKSRKDALETAETLSISKAKKNIKKEFFPIIYKELSNNKKIRQYAIYLAETNSLSNDSMKKTLLSNKIIWSGYLCKENNHSNTPFKTIKEIIQNSINAFLSPRNPIDVNSKIPQKIDKPELPALPTLVKSQFETKEMFEKKVQEAMDKRQLQINALQEKYRKDVEERNKIIEQLSIEYESDIEKIKEEQKQKREKLPEIVMEFTRKAFFEIMGEPRLENPVYDAESEIMYVDLKAANADYEKRISVNIPLEIAEGIFNEIKKNISKSSIKKDNHIEFTLRAPNAKIVSVAGEFNEWNPKLHYMYKDGDIWKLNLKLEPGRYEYKFIINDSKWLEDPKNPEKSSDGYGGHNSVLNVWDKDNEISNKQSSVYPIVLYSIDNTNIKLEKIKLNYRGYTYLANLTEEDFKPETIEVVLEDKKIEFDSEKQINLELQNPNLIDTYRVSAIQYGESPEAKGLTYNDDITPLVEKLEGKLEDPKKWLFIIAVEDYDEMDPVIFAKNSGELFKETAKKVFGIKERNTYALIDNKATSGAIKDNLQLLLKHVKEGDVIYFYYSGHGVPVQKSGESYILPKDKIVDYISKEEEFQLSKIYRNLSDSKASKIFVFIDACFSGKTDNIPLFKGVAPGLMRTKEIQFDESKMVVITAGTDLQFSNSFDEKGHRMFSYYLIKSLATRKDIDIDLLYKDISVKVHDTSFEKGDAYIQEPQIYGNKNLDIFNEEK